MEEQEYKLKQRKWASAYLELAESLLEPGWDSDKGGLIQPDFVGSVKAFGDASRHYEKAGEIEDAVKAGENTALYAGVFRLHQKRTWGFEGSLANNLETQTKRELNRLKQLKGGDEK